MERRTLARHISTVVLTVLLGAAWQTGAAWEDLRGRPGLRPGEPPGPAAPPTAEPLVVTIVNPGAAAIETADASMTLQGSASGTAGVAGVYWRSDRGLTGLATGTTTWGTGPIPLVLGANEITVTAYDGAGNTASDVIVIRRESAQQQSVTLNWAAPSRRVDGSALTDLAGYKIHYGRMPGTYDYQIRIDNPGILSYIVDNLSPGDWYFSMTAFDSDGTESGYSNEALERVQ